MPQRENWAKDMSHTYIPLRRINDTLRISVPIEFKRRYDLKEGDQVMWIEDENGVRLRFAKTRVELVPMKLEEKVA